MFWALAALAVLLAGTAPAARAATAATAAPPAAPRLAQQTAATWYGVEVIVFRTSSVNSVEDWDAVPPGRGFWQQRRSRRRHAAGTASAHADRLPAQHAGGDAENQRRLAPGGARSLDTDAANWGTRCRHCVVDVGINVPGLSGMVYLERAPIYLHLGFDVRLSAGQAMAIREMRSVRYNDRQYFDHPGFGIIAVVTPIKRAEPAPGSSP